MNQSSLLAYLYPYFKGSQEDVATSSLGYILSCNEYINQTFTNHISRVLELDLNDKYQYKCQAVGENKERPDMAGYDSNGNEKILCESKFYAALTINQPNNYLKRLIDEKGKGLIFICPEIRKQGLWNEILKIADKEFTKTYINDFCVEIENSVRLGITTWKALLDDLEQTAIVNAVAHVPDIKQLQGYCEQLDKEAFIPFVDEDLGIDEAMKSERPYILLDALVDEIKSASNHTVSLKGLKSTPVRCGYRRYLMIDDYAVNLEYDTWKWKNSNSVITPFWICIYKIIDNRWVQDAQIEKMMLRISSEMKDDGYIALIPKKYVALSEIAADMKEQVFRYIRMCIEA